MTFTDQVGLIRRVALEIGRRLAESSLLDEPDDVFFLEIGGSRAPPCRPGRRGRLWTAGSWSVAAGRNGTGWRLTPAR